MKDVLGAGWAFPVAVNPRGRIAMVQGEQAVAQSILMLLMTPKGQRVMRPEYGCRIHELVFAPNDATTLGLASYYVDEALRMWEPRINVGRVNARTDPADASRILIDVNYTMRQDASPRSLVFPFYRLPEEN
ncbi:GPW/gp25 family protein [Deinococcus maricopensis]|uniref:GPW/gp25 family protein n=1 Tax=Deinococcus maricopensis (strain DSM 21211 / LMG 22137 / NRRL B-23946 / LB-34) TaxID=709986 RepID=E8U3P0_DEIML|nr:GPW/gp25 family protein [Deinococcus maricopensis]ADV68664.1 GPW/gp25 family protein [Deinococcus maricopensis DSM 21211]